MNRVVYLHGFASSPQSTKARFFGDRFAELGVGFEVPDLAAGDLEHLTISGQLRVIEQACRGEAVMLMGSSMGGYLAALYAAKHPEVTKLVLMAPAFGLPRFGLLKTAEPYEDFPDFQQPALIFHGIEDTVVPSHLSETFAATHPNVKLHLLNSDHGLTDMLHPMWKTIRASIPA
jgi:pimeloyl-ACP methyl ester carboxylesterase